MALGNKKGVINNLSYDIFHEILSYLNVDDLYMIKDKDVLKRDVDITLWCRLTTLHLCNDYAVTGYTEVVNFLYKQGQHVTITSFSLAARLNHITTIQLIIDQDQCEEKTHIYDKLILEDTIEQVISLGYTRMAQLLIKHYIVEDDKTYVRYMFSAVYHGHLELFQWMYNNTDLEQLYIQCIYSICRKKNFTHIRDFLKTKTDGCIRYCSSDSNKPRIYQYCKWCTGYRYPGGKDARVLVTCAAYVNVERITAGMRGLSYSS